MALKELLKKALSWLWNSVPNLPLQWVEVHISPGKRSESTIRRHAYLRAHGIRCKLVRLGFTSLYGTDNRVVSLRVHKDDIVKARQLMQEFRD
ncbi:hypothetical protein [Desulfatibacillum aliphaticivorans]|uniref:hypothetical protein n=1 Tax=Desulfatibacillum aliphaticivorans TaxID=218208 RepID=UPI0004895F4B|nr:hypothetical protein [Desulfatibacillum aliphaticivorans]